MQQTDRLIYRIVIYSNSRCACARRLPSLLSIGQFILDVTEYYDIEYSIHHDGGQHPVCKGNETHVMQCTMMSTTSCDCHPVLVKCVSSSESANSNVNIAAAVSVPLLLVVGTGVCVVPLHKQIERKQI